MSVATPTRLPEREIPDGQVAGAADQFRNAAALLFEHLTELANTDRIGQFNCVLPLLVLSGFALELYLKSLNAELRYHDLADELGVPGGRLGYRVTSEPVKGHALTGLHDALDSSIQNELNQAYVESHVIPGCPTFRDALEPYNRVFENARYIFENNRTLPNRGLTDLMALVSFVAHFVEEMPRRHIARR